MALYRKKDDGAPSKKKDTDAASAKGGRGGSFENPQSKASSGGYTYTKPAAVEETYENFDTMKALAKAQRGLYAYEEDSKKNFHTSNFFRSFAPADAPQIVHDFHAAVNAYAGNR